MPDDARMIMLQNRVVRAFQHPHAVGKAELGPKDLGLTDAQKAKLKLMSLRRKGGDAPVVPEPIPQEEKPELPRTTSERVAELKAEREAAAAEAAKEAEAAPLLSAEEEMAREMEAARREAEAMMASFQAAHEESKEDVEAPPQPSATGPRRLAPGPGRPLRASSTILRGAGSTSRGRRGEKEGSGRARFLNSRRPVGRRWRSRSILPASTGRRTGVPVVPQLRRAAWFCASAPSRCPGRRRPSGSRAGCRSGWAGAADPYRRGGATPRASPSPLPVLGFAGCSRPSGRRPL